MSNLVPYRNSIINSYLFNALVSKSASKKTLNIKEKDVLKELIFFAQFGLDEVEESLDKISDIIGKDPQLLDRVLNYLVKNDASSCEEIIEALDSFKRLDNLDIDRSNLNLIETISSSIKNVLFQARKVDIYEMLCTNIYAIPLDSHLNPHTNNIYFEKTYLSDEEINSLEDNLNRDIYTETDGDQKYKKLSSKYLGEMIGESTNSDTKIQETKRILSISEHFLKDLKKGDYIFYCDNKNINSGNKPNPINDLIEFCDQDKLLAYEISHICNSKLVLCIFNAFNYSKIVNQNNQPIVIYCSNNSDNRYINISIKKDDNKRFNIELNAIFPIEKLSYYDTEEHIIGFDSSSSYINLNGSFILDSKSDKRLKINESPSMLLEGKIFSFMKN